VVDLGILCGMFINIRMPDAINSYVVKMVLIVILQVEIYKILHCSSLYGRNRQYAGCENGDFHDAVFFPSSDKLIFLQMYVLIL